MPHNKSLKCVPRFALHRTRLKPRRLAQTLDERQTLLRITIKLLYWWLRLGVPPILVGMLLAPLLLNPPSEITEAAIAHSNDAIVFPVGGRAAQYTFLRLSDGASLNVELKPGATPSVREDSGGLVVWVVSLVLLSILSWLLWRPERSSPNKGFNRTPASSGPAKPGVSGGGAG